jgi:hypothetical protein
VAGLVIPDTYRLTHDGEVIDRTPGLKRIAIRSRADGGTYEEDIDATRTEALTLDDDMLAQLSHLARHCEEVYGNARDIEWAVDDGTVYLLQCRAVTTTSAKSSAIDPTAAVPENDPADVLTSVPLFSGLSDDEVDRIAALCKARRFAPGDVVIREGSGGASFYVIDSGAASVSIRGDEVAVLGPGDHFGEIALIDGGQRLATVTATTDLVCHGLTYWEFRPLVQESGALGWKLLQTMARMLRAAEESPA